MSIEAMRYALAALEWNLPVIEDYGHKEQLNRQRKAITAIKQALKQPVQEPVAWCTKSDLENMAKGFSQDVPARSMRVPQLYPKEGAVLLYTTPPAAPVQLVQPVAWMHTSGHIQIFHPHWEQVAVDGYTREKGWTPLYTTPQRQWVGLTDEQIIGMYNEPRSDAEMIAFGREVEAKLKEKNT